MKSGETLTAHELRQRKPVWAALSELWLDVELESGDFERIAGVLSVSGYSIEELTDIYYYEVAPAVSGNLQVPAGVWTAFDPDWLFAATQRRAEHRSLWLRFWIGSGIGRTFLQQREFSTLLRLVQQRA